MPQNASAIRCSPRWRTSSTRVVAERVAALRAAPERRRRARRAPAAARAPSAAPWMTQGTTCSRRQNAALRSPAGSASAEAVVARRSRSAPAAELGPWRQSLAATAASPDADRLPLHGRGDAHRADDHRPRGRRDRAGAARAGAAASSTRTSSGSTVELERFDLSLENRRATDNEVVDEAARAMREAGLGIKAATITPEGKRRRRLAQPHPARGDRRQGDHPHRPPHPRRHAGRRRPLPDLRRPHGRRATPTAPSSGARATRARPTRSPTAPSGSRARPAARSPSTRSGPPRKMQRQGLRRAQVDGLARSTRGCSRRRWTRAAERHPDVAYQPVLIDATYAGLICGAADAPLVIPALNRDGDCLSDLVMPMFGSIAGAESVLLAFDERLRHAGRDGRGAARHRAGAAGQGRRQPDGDDPRRARAVLHYAARQGPRGRRAAPRARSTRPCSRPPPPASARPTSAATPARPSSPTRSITRVRTKIDVWSSLGATV